MYFRLQMMIPYLATFRTLIVFASCVLATALPGQCPVFTYDGLLATDIEQFHCEGYSFTMLVNGTGIADGSEVHFYLTEGTQDPYFGFGTFIGSVPVTDDGCGNPPQVLYIMINPDDTQVGSSNDKCDEFMILWTGSGGYSTSDIVVSNLSNGTAQWNDFVAGDASMLSCGTALPPGPVPPNSILIIQGSNSPNLFVDLDFLCLQSLPIYVIAYNDFSCTGGWFDNEDPCNSCPVEIDITGTCAYTLQVNYTLPAMPLNGWAWSHLGSGEFGNVVAPLDVPDFDTLAVSIPDFSWTFPADYCETIGIGYSMVVAVIDPPAPAGCPNIHTTYYGVGMSCPKIRLANSEDICAGNCPDDPASFEIIIDGVEPVLTVDILVTIPGFSDLTLSNIPASNGDQIDICLGGMEHSFDFAARLLTLPSSAIGSTLTFQILSATSPLGCEVDIDLTPVIISLLEAPAIDGGADQQICSNTSANLTAVFAGSTTSGMWSTNGDGVFDNATSPQTQYHPGPIDLLLGNVELHLIGTDAQGICPQAEDSLTLTFHPAPEITTPSDAVVCVDSTLTLNITITGAYNSVTWVTDGDGTITVNNDFEITYNPGPQDKMNGAVILEVTVESTFTGCGEFIVNIPVMIIDCDCPALETQAPASALCITIDTFDLSTLLVQGGPGAWTITSSPPGGNPATIVNNNLVITNSDVGNYTLTYTLDNPEPGCPASSSEAIIVSPDFQPDLGSDLLGCSGEGINLTAQFSSAIPAGYEWKTQGDGTFQHTATSATYTPGQNDSGQQVLIVYLVSEGGCAPQSDSVMITYVDPPFATFVSDTIRVCNASSQGSTLNLPAQITGGDHTGTWTNLSGAPIDLSDLTAVDFDGLAPALYLFEYQTQSASPPCMESVYQIIIAVEECCSEFGIDVLAFDCDEMAMTYDVTITTDASTLFADHGVLIANGPGNFTLEDVPIGTDILIALISASGICLNTVTLPAPNCTCTLETEDIPPLTSMCPGDTFVLMPMITGAQGPVVSTWTGTTQETGLSYSVFTEGPYTWMVVDSAGCVETDTFYVIVSEDILIDISPIAPSCVGLPNGQMIIENISGGLEPYTLQIDEGIMFMSDQWPDTLSDFASGIYQLHVTDSDGCESTFTVVIDEAVAGMLDLGPDVTITYGDSLLIEPVVSDIVIDQISWFPESIAENLSAFYFTPTRTITISVLITDDRGCTYTDEKTITVVIEPDFYIPNVFSPNGDQINDLLEVHFASDAIIIESIEIFDRWGGLQYRSIGAITSVWDGKSQGEELPAGVYVLKMQYQDANAERHVHYQDVTLVR